MSATERQGKPAPGPPASGTLGMFTGVFTPSILTILGIILFLRLGFVVGQAGLPRAILIILLANGISVLTSISLAAIATNLRVGGGGDYYLISRTLGVEYGGALGLVLFLAQSVSVAFYAIGFGEALANLLAVAVSPWFIAAWVPQAIAACSITALLVLAWLGADLASRFQFVVMAVLAVALIGFYVGGLSRLDGAVLYANLRPAGELPFWALFAIFFPAVTGFTQGVSMSGDLRDPGRALPLGTFLAVGLSLLVYLGTALVLAATLPNAELAGDFQAMRRISVAAWLVDAGVIAATLSSALASFLGAPRILQSLASDRVFPHLLFFARGHGPTANPRRAVVLCAAIAYATVALGRLNVIAPVVSMFFLISYGLLNYATYFEARANSPWFRPRFRFFHARASLVGALACLGAMLAIHPLAGAIAVALLFAIHQYLASTVRVHRWADSARAHRFQRVREDLLAISHDLEHPRYWRPVLLAFSDDPERRGRLLRFASWLEGRSGFITLVRIVAGEGLESRRLRREAQSELQAEIDRLELPAFARAIVAPDPDRAVPVLLQAHGLATVRPNTVLLNWFDRPQSQFEPKLRAYGRYLRLALRFDCNLVLLAAGEPGFEAVERARRSERRIDVWYRQNATGRLALLLAYLMTRTETWEDAPIRLLARVQDGGDPGELRAELDRMLRDVRIPARPEVVEVTEAADVARCCEDASVVLLPFRLEGEQLGSVFEGPLDGLLDPRRITALVLAAEDIELDTQPGSGRHAEIAEVVDAADKEARDARGTEKDAARAAAELTEAREALDAARATGEPTGEELSRLEKAVAEAEQAAERAKRRAAKQGAKAASAKAEAEEALGPEGD